MNFSDEYFEHQFRTLRGCVKHNGNSDVLVHMDGSEESFISAAFCVKTFGKDHVVALITPDIHTKHILAAKHCESLDLKTYTIPVTLSVADILHQIRVAGINVSADTIFRASGMLASDVVYLVAKELNAYAVNKFYLNDYELQRFVQLYGLPEIKEDEYDGIYRQ